MNITGSRAPHPDRIVRRARFAVFCHFALNGFVMGIWASGLPALDERLGLGAGRLGSVLLLVSGGALLSMLIAGRLVDTWSSARICRLAGPISAAVLLGPALAGSYAWLAVFAVLFGLGVGVIEVSMNTHSVEVEHRYGRPIVSAFHGVWSLGGAAAGGLTAGVLRIGIDGQVLLIAVAVVVPFAFLPAARLLLPAAPAGEPPAPVREGGPGHVREPGHVRAGASEPAGGDGPEAPAQPEPAARRSAQRPTTPPAASPAASPAAGQSALRWGVVALLGVCAFAGHMSEGAAMDWAAVHARWVLDVDPAIAPLAYTVFAVAMTTVRLLGDPIRARLGSARTIQLAGLHATAGYALILAAPLTGKTLEVVCAWAGWALAGVGLATVVPVLFSSVGASGGAVGRALSLITACGYTGLLLGPAVLGYVAEHTSLPVALVIPGVMAVLITVVGTPAVRRLTEPRRTYGGGDGADAGPSAGDESRRTDTAGGITPAGGART